MFCIFSSESCANSQRAPCYLEESCAPILVSNPRNGIIAAPLDVDDYDIYFTMKPASGPAPRWFFQSGAADPPDDYGHQPDTMGMLMGDANFGWLGTDTVWFCNGITAFTGVDCGWSAATDGMRIHLTLSGNLFSYYSGVFLVIFSQWPTIINIPVRAAAFY